MSTEQAQVSLDEKIGNGVDRITHADLLKGISTKCPTGISRIDGLWVMDSDVPSSTRGTIAASYIELDLEHMDMYEFDANWTVTDYILEAIRIYEEREEQEKAVDEAFRVEEEIRRQEEEENFA